MTSALHRAPHRPPDDVPGLLRALLTDDPGRPRVTWYGREGERIELSAKVLDNWVAKTANLLVEELDAGPGTRVGVLLPAHWRTLVWVLACWSVGAHVVVPAGADAGNSAVPALSAVPAADLVLGSDPVLLTDLGHDHAGRPASQLVAVALGGLAVRFGPDLPDGALDAAAEVRLYGDVFVPPVRPAASDEALTVAADPALTYADLLGAARAASVAWPERPRLLTGDGPDRAVASWLAPLAGLGSVVLHHDLGGLDDAAVARLSSQERVTLTLPGR